MSSLSLTHVSGLCFVTGEIHSKEQQEVGTPARTVKKYLPAPKGKSIPVWSTVHIPAKTKLVLVNVVTPVTVVFPAGENFCGTNRVGAAYDLACRMVEDGLKNVHISNFDDGESFKFTKAQVNKRDKAIIPALKIVKQAEKDNEGIETLRKAA